MEQIEKWYKTEIEPILSNCGQYLRKGKAPENILEWWHIFSVNSTALFEVMGRANETYQYASTMRLLVEIGADLDFISKNPSNIASFEEEYKKVCQLADDNGEEIKYVDLTRQMKKYQLKGDDGIRSKTMDRIKMAYNENFVEIYNYLSCYNHFNFCAVRYTTQLSIPGNEAQLLQERLHIAALYPAALDVTLRALRKICGIKDEIPYDLPTLLYYCSKRLMISMIADARGNIGYRLAPLYRPPHSAVKKKEQAGKRVE